jgi:hypothetical protein
MVDIGKTVTSSGRHSRPNGEWILGFEEMTPRRVGVKGG